MEQEFDVAAQVRDGVARDLGTAFRLGEDEGALQHRLRISCTMVPRRQVNS